MRVIALNRYSNPPKCHGPLELVMCAVILETLSKRLGGSEKKHEWPAAGRRQQSRRG
jgi:hypothetical protein